MTKRKNVRVNYKLEIYSSKLRWRLMKGTNGIYSGTVGYLSRRGIQIKLVIYGLTAVKPEDSMKHGFSLKPVDSTARGFFNPES